VGAKELDVVHKTMTADRGLARMIDKHMHDVRTCIIYTHQHAWSNAYDPMYA